MLTINDFLEWTTTTVQVDKRDKEQRETNDRKKEQMLQSNVDNSTKNQAIIVWKQFILQIYSLGVIHLRWTSTVTLVLYTNTMMKDATQ